MKRKSSPTRLDSTYCVIVQTRSVIESGRRDLQRLNAAVVQLNGIYKESLALIALPRTSADLSHSIRAEAAMEDRSRLERRLALAEEHIAKIAGLVARQRKLVEELERDHSYFAPDARALLTQYEESHAMLASKRARLLYELHPEKPDGEVA
jgi:uncharacterized coiled-coil protein SlyX